MRKFRPDSSLDRSAQSSTNWSDQAEYGLFVDSDRATVSIDGRPVSVTAKEFQALSYLYSRRGGLCTKDELARRVWPEYEGAVGDYNIEQLVSRLRRKLEPDHRHPRYLLTVRGLGYRLETSGMRDSVVADRRRLPGRLIPIAFGFAVAAAAVILVLALLPGRGGNERRELSGGVSSQHGWLLRDADDFSNPEKSLFPKGAGSTNVGLIFSRGVEGGEYVVRILKGPERSGLSSTVSPVFLETFAFEAEARGNGQIQYGLTLFWGSADFLQLRLNPATVSYELFHGPEGSLIRRENSPLVKAGEAANHLRFEVRGNQLSVLINGTLAETVTLDSIVRRPATPGLFLYLPMGQEVAEGSGIKVLFDNFRLLAGKDS